MESFKFTNLSLPGVFKIKFLKHEDRRGFFSEIFRKNVLDKCNIGPLVQENHSRSWKNVVRGLHYQVAPAEVGKLVYCSYGRIFDVAVDIRRESKTFGQYACSYLQNEALWIPRGFAHGFCVVSDYADVIYKQDNYYSSEHERTIKWNSPQLNIKWPVDNPILSSKDFEAQEFTK